MPIANLHPPAVPILAVAACNGGNWWFATWCAIVAGPAQHAACSLRKY